MTFPLSFIQSLIDKTKSSRGGPVVLQLIMRFLNVIIDNQLAWALDRQQQSDEKLLLDRAPDFFVAHDPVGGRYRVYPADINHLRSADPCEHYRHARGLAHELIHVLDHSNPGLLSLQSVPWCTHQVSFDERRPGTSILGLLDKATFDDDDADRTIREILAEDLALALLAAPRDFGLALRSKDMTNVEIAKRFSISVDDVGRYVQVLLMCPDEELASVGLNVADLLAYLGRSGYDPIKAFISSAAKNEQLPNVSAVDAPHFDLDLEARDLIRGLGSIVKEHLKLAALRPNAPSALSTFVEHFVRRHSGSELRFMLRRVSPAPLMIALQLLALRDPVGHLACLGLLCIKLGQPEFAVQQIEAYKDHRSEARLLGTLAAAYFSMRDTRCNANAFSLYLKAHELDTVDPEVRFGLAKCIMRREDMDEEKRLDEAERFLLKFPGMHHWLENYLLGKISFIRYCRSLSPKDLAASERYLLRALESPHRWPPRIVEFVDVDDRATWMSPADLLDIDGDRKKVINLLAKITEIRSDKNPSLRRLSWILLRRSWEAHKLDCKTNFCLYQFHEKHEPAKALLRLRELLYLRPDDLLVRTYLRNIIMKHFPQWRSYGEGLTRAIERVKRNK